MGSGSILAVIDSCAACLAALCIDAGAARLGKIVDQAVHGAEVGTGNDLSPLPFLRDKAGVGQGRKVMGQS